MWLLLCFKKYCILKGIHLFFLECMYIYIYIYIYISCITSLQIINLMLKPDTIRYIKSTIIMETTGWVFSLSICLPRLTLQFTIFFQWNTASTCVSSSMRYNQQTNGKQLIRTHQLLLLPLLMMMMMIKWITNVSLSYMVCAALSSQTIFS